MERKKLTLREEFELYFPYGFIIHKATKRYSAFNRFYKKLGEPKDRDWTYRSVEELLNFVYCPSITEETIDSIKKIFVFTRLPKVQEFVEDGNEYLRIWFYKTESCPFSTKSNFRKNKMSEYKDALWQVESLLNDVSFEEQAKILSIQYRKDIGN